MNEIVYQCSSLSENSPAVYVGKIIASAALADDRLRIGFTDGGAIEISDDGQSGEERRYMQTDDELLSLVGHRLTRVEAKDAPNEAYEDREHEEYYEDRKHEIVFIEIGTDEGVVTFAAHNEHNGYYSGFVLTIHEAS